MELKVYTVRVYFVLLRCLRKGRPRAETRPAASLIKDESGKVTHRTYHDDAVRILKKIK
jgi:hypothetical protein